MLFLSTFPCGKKSTLKKSFKPSDSQNNKQKTPQNNNNQKIAQFKQVLFKTQNSDILPSSGDWKQRC